MTFSVQFEDDDERFTVISPYNIAWHAYGKENGFWSYKGRDGWSFFPKDFPKVMTAFFEIYVDEGADVIVAELFA